MQKFVAFGVLLLALTAVAPAVLAQTSVESAQARATLIAERTTVAPGDTLWVGLHLQMKPGWHTYWRTPGDSGLPTTITWKLPTGFTAGAIQWPPPKRVPTDDLMNFGYEDDVTLVAPIKVDAGQGPIALEADASWLVCSDVCIPEDGHFAMRITVAASAGEPGPDAALIEQARANIPKDAPFAVSAARSGADIVLTLGPDLPAGVKSATLFPDGDGAIANAAPQPVKLADGRLTLRVPAGATPPTHLTGVVVLEGATRTGYEIKTDLPPAPAADADVTIWLALLFAVLGGLALNVMPCVLPVLVMKALSMLSHRDNAATMRRDALIYSAGVVAAFTALVALLLILRAAGTAVGWGFQLQNPVVVAILANIMLALGLSLSGVFTIGGGVAGIGQELAAREGGWGSFFTGILAVVVATPCTAPFMGVALGFALTQNAFVAVAIFEGLAIGLALPYLAIAFIPALARRLPRPGIWMERLKQILAFALYGAAAWLVWVLAQQLDPSGLALAFASLIAVGFAAWSFGVAPMAAHRRSWSVVAIVAILLAGTTIAAISGRGAVPVTAADAADVFTPARVSELRAQGKAVLVDFTAAWCITCLVNERVALSTREVKDALHNDGVALLKADWTNRNPEITSTLHDLGRDGVPLYVFYPKSGAPRILPQVLTPALVVEALKTP